MVCIEYCSIQLYVKVCAIPAIFPKGKETSNKLLIYLLQLTYLGKNKKQNVHKMSCTKTTSD